jgi:hypothetical protein
MTYKINRNVRCKICEERVSDIRKEYGDYAVEAGIFSGKLDGWVCGPCVEAEETDPRGTVLVYKPQEGLVERYRVMTHTDYMEQATVEDEEDLLEPHFDGLEPDVMSPIQFEWHRTDPWRGYYEAVGEGWVRVHDDAILAGSRDAEELAKFHEKIIKLLWRLGRDGAIKEFAVAYGRTSNLFSTGYDILVHKDDAIVVLPAINILALQHRDPERFTLTALTGKSEFDEKDKLLLEAWKRVQAGEDPAKVEEDIRRRVVEGGEVH